jgi:hypothetical protein
MKKDIETIQKRIKELQQEIKKIQAEKLTNAGRITLSIFLNSNDFTTANFDKFKAELIKNNIITEAKNVSL